MMSLAWPNMINFDRIRPFVANRLLRRASCASTDDAQSLFGRIIENFGAARALPSGLGTGAFLDVESLSSNPRHRPASPRSR